MSKGVNLTKRVGFVALAGVLLATLAACSSGIVANGVASNQSIQAAIEAAAPGTTLTVYGTHKENVTLDVNNITLQPGPGGGAIDGNLTVTGDYDAIKNMTISGELLTSGEGFKNLTLDPVTIWGDAIEGAFTCSEIISDGGNLQTAIDGAVSGDSICAAPGTYDAFSIDSLSNFSVSGFGRDYTKIVPSTLIDSGIGHKSTADMRVVVLVNGSTNVSVKYMGIQSTSTAPGSGASRGADAIVFWNASTGSIEYSTVSGVYAINGEQTGQGIALDAGSGDRSDLLVQSCDISGFQKNGIDVVDGNSSTSNPGTITFDVEGGSITGAGATSAIAPNGVSGWNNGGGNVTGTVNGTSISDFNFTPTTASDSGIIAYAGASVTPVSSSSFSNFGSDEYFIAAAGSTSIDATDGNTFDGVSPATATSSQLTSIESQLLGTVTIK